MTLWVRESAYVAFVREVEILDNKIILLSLTKQIYYGLSLS